MSARSKYLRTLRWLRHYLRLPAVGRAQLEADLRDPAAVAGLAEQAARAGLGWMPPMLAILAAAIEAPRNSSELGQSPRTHADRVMLSRPDA